MRTVKYIFLISALLLQSKTASADLFYDPAKSDELRNLTSVQSARLSMEYVCQSSSLYLSTYAATSEINGRSASVSGKIVTGEKSYDVSPDLSKAIEAEDVLTRGLNVMCNQDSGVFQIVFSREARAGESTNKITTINIYADGTVIGSRSRRRVKTKK